MYKKDYDGWNIVKQQVNWNTKQWHFQVREREIRYAKVGINIGTEINGKENYLRPVLILKKVWSLYWILPLTTKGKNENKYYHKIISYNFYKPSYCILSQIKSIDHKRFLYQIWILSKTEFSQIKKSLLQRLI
jgi:mRNA interferase MazF